MAEIYGIYSARNGIVRYVGETAGARAVRFEQHIRQWPEKRLQKWLFKEWTHGYPVRCALLQQCSDESRQQVETEWIARFRNLLNERKVRRSTRTEKPPDIPEIVRYMREHVFNVNGFRGVHYEKGWDRYFVMIDAGRRLLGDEAPNPWWPDIEGGNIWFSDLASAVKARDTYRQSIPSLYWLPDGKL
jgi:hypothetical protein